jgi:AraC-like DNA-binding protein
MTRRMSDPMDRDILTELFASMPFDRAKTTLSELHSPWGLALPGHYLTGFHAALEGSWELRVPPLPAITMHAGDVAFFPVGRPHDVRDRATTGLVPVTAADCVEHVGQSVKLLRHGGRGGRTRVLTVVLPVDMPWRTPVLGALPPLIVVPGDGARPAPALAALVQRLVEEAERRRPGYIAATRRLIELLILEMLRTKVDDGEVDASLLHGLGDRGISAALTAMHQEVNRDWSVSELAALAGMSRSLFAARFAAVVGVAPHRYLVRFRLQHAAQLLRSRELSIPEVSARVGYRSESSFSRVFAREMGVPPATYRKQQWAGAIVNAGREADGRRAPESGPRSLHSKPDTRPRRQGIG